SARVVRKKRRGGRARRTTSVHPASQVFRKPGRSQKTSPNDPAARRAHEHRGSEGSGSQVVKGSKLAHWHTQGTDEPAGAEAQLGWSVPPRWASASSSTRSTRVWFN